MSNNLIPSIEILPVEIFHRIFDNLDTETILLSIRLVCRLFRSIFHYFKRYYFEFKIKTKRNFHLFCRLIKPENVISLTLSDNEHIPNQIYLFISLISLRQFTRLHSINFLGIDEYQLNIILKRIHLNSLISFSLNIQKYDDRRKKTTLHFLSSIMTKSNLRKIELNIKYDRISNIVWPLNCNIRYLIINEDIYLDDLCRILSNSSQLHTLILKENIINDKIVTSSFPQLTSLTIERLDITIDKLESLLLLTPSLIYLKLIGEGNLCDGKRWEEFIQINLSHLDKFEFFINISRSINRTREDLELIIESFRTPFWIEYKQWFVICEFHKRSYKVQLYSIPICKSIYQYELNTENIFVSNSTISLYNNPSITNHINEINLSLKLSTNHLIKQEVCLLLNDYNI